MVWQERQCRALAAAALALVACGGEGSTGTGAAELTTWGEAYIEQGIPASDFEDGWAVTFDSFVLGLAAVTIADAAGETAAAMSSSKVFDHVSPGVKAVARFDGIEAKAWDRVSFEIAPPAADAALEGATESDRQLLLDEGAAVIVAGKATKGAVEKTFRWAFTQTTLYSACSGQMDGKETEGVLVTSGGTDSAQITIHGDHLFYDDLTADSAKVRFQHIADADADGDGAVTLDELGTVALVDLPAEAGPFGTGSAGDVDDLRAFVVSLSGTLGHFRGEGECTSTRK